MASTRPPEESDLEARVDGRSGEIPRHYFPRTLPQLADVDGVGSDWLSSQLAKIERSTEENESLRRRVAARGEVNNEGDDEDLMMGEEGGVGIESKGTEVQRLAKLEGEIRALSLAADFAACRPMVDFAFPSTLPAETQYCVAFAEVLSRHEPSLADSPSLYRVLLDRYQELHKYIRARATLSVRRSLRKCNYPAGSGCDVLSDELATAAANSDGSQDESFATAASALVKLQLMHDHLMYHIGHYDNNNHTQKLDLIDELCRPVVKRVCYHFITDDGSAVEGNRPSNSKSAQGAIGEPVRSTGSRLDCLPQWLFHHMKEIISEGPYGFITEDLQPLINRSIEGLWKEVAGNDNDGQNSTVASWHEYEAASSYFLSEMVKASQQVLEERAFFSDASIVGENANPVYLSNAVEQLLMFDSFISNLLANEEAYPATNRRGNQRTFSLNAEVNRPQRGTSPMRPPRLIDSFIALDEVLLEWWASMDKHYMLSTLVATTQSGTSEAYVRVLAGNKTATAGKLPISPTAETFLALLHSARSKAEAIGFPDGRRTYVANAVVPLCMRFMDLMHEQASAMRDLLVQRKKGGAPPTDEHLEKNFLCWIEVVTGTHLAAAALLHSGSGEVVTLGADEDLARVGRSLERLRDAMVDECGSSFIETILCERAKLVSYLMRAPHMLSSRSTIPGDHISLSPDLNEVAHILCTTLGVCDKVIKEVQESLGPGQEDQNQVPGTLPQQENITLTSFEFAAKSIKANLARRLEEKLLEVALDIHDMVPVVGLGGAQQFQCDMQVLIGTFGHHEMKERGPGAPTSTLGSFTRLVDVTTFMALDDFFSLREAVYSLVRDSHVEGLDEFTEEELAYEALSADETLMEQAKSMIQAKGFPRLAVEDALAVMKRRQS